MSGAVSSALLRRGLAGIPEQVRAQAAAHDRLRMRADAGYLTGDLAHAAVAEGCGFAIAAKRNTAMWGAYAGVAETDWGDAKAMPGAQVAAVDYPPAGWPVDTYTIVRRTIAPDQLTLALEGTATHPHAVSFIVTNIPIHHHSDNGETIREVEPWFRRRTDIEDRIREAKLGAALRHLPSRHHAVNTGWRWAALLAGNLSTLLQAPTRIDQNGRAHGTRLRHQLLCVPARPIHHGRSLTLRLPPGQQPLPTVLARIRELDTAA